MKKLLLLILVFISTLMQAQPVISFQSLVTGLSNPLDVTNANDGTNRLYIVEKRGTIRIWDGSALRSDTFLNIIPKVRSTGSEQGLLSLAFHPNYATNGYFYVYYTNLAGNVTIARYSRSSLNAADSSSGVVLMTIYKPFANHNGGDLNFGSDGNLYFGIGDGGNGGDPGNRAQNGDTLLGKMLRIDVNNPNPPYYNIPATNPFINDPSISDEIIALGLRNPWRWSFDRQTGNMWIADVGQDAWEEVNVVPPASILGANYQWSCQEGTHFFKSDCGSQNKGTSIAPIFDYPHDNATGGYSITGGFVYRGTEFPALQGYYIASDYVSNHGWLIKSNGAGGWTTTFQPTWATNISSYGEGADGSLYATSLTQGILYKVIANGALPLHISSLSGAVINNYHQLSWNVANEEPGDIYIIERRSSANEPFTEVYTTSAGYSRASNNYTVKVNALASAETFYRLKTISKSGQIQYSAVIRIINNRNADAFKAFVSGKNLYANVPPDARSIALYNAEGKLMIKQAVTGGSSFLSIPLQKIPRGLLIVKVQLKDQLLTSKLVY